MRRRWRNLWRELAALSLVGAAQGSQGLKLFQRWTA